MKYNMAYLFFQVVTIFNKTECVWGAYFWKGACNQNIKKNFISRTKRVDYSKNVVILRVF